MIKVNLLTEDIREDIEYSKKNRNQINNFYTLLLLLVFVVIASGVSFQFMRQSNDSYIAEVERTQKVINSYQPVVQKARNMEDKYNQIKSFKNKYIYWSNVDKLLEEKKVEDITLTSLELQNPKLTLAGWGKTKEDVANFQRNLRDSGMFWYVNIMSIESEKEDSTERENFSMSTSIKEELLKDENY